MLLFAAGGMAARRACARLRRKLRAKGVALFAVTNDDAVAELADDALVLRSPLPEALTPISFAVAAQHLAVALARRHGRDAERPRGLSKVTRTR